VKPVRNSGLQAGGELNPASETGGIIFNGIKEYEKEEIL
jgi:hypothetical protein